MGAWGIGHWIVVAVIVMLLFGRGKVSELMGDVAKGIKAFKKGMADDDEPQKQDVAVGQNDPVRTLPHQPGAAGTTQSAADRKIV